MRATATKPHLALLALLAVTVVGSAGAQQPPELERGFKPELVYQFNGLDSVNLFNGNLNMSIPLGDTYPVGGGLSYSFVLRYSGNVWLGREDCTYGRQESTETRCGFRYIPHMENAGLGWRLSFGELKPPLVGPEWGSVDMARWRYVSPDGGEHYFYPTLHGCTPGAAYCEPEIAGVLYTRDSSYLRMKDDGPAAKIVEFPDGRRQRFENHGTDAQPKWRLTLMYTGPRPGSTTPENWVKFEYGTGSNYTVTDSSNTTRRHEVVFKSHPTITTYHVVDRVSLAAFSGSATYQFAYDFGSSATLLARPCGILSGSNMSVHLLTGLILPEGDTYGFDYNRPLNTCGDEGLQSGTLSKAVLPTLGELRWTYRNNALTARGNGTPQAVHERRVYDADGVEIERRIYTQSATNASLESPAAKTTVENFIQNSAGAWELDSKTVSYFNLAKPEAGGVPADFGLPYAPAGADTEAPNPDGSDKQRYLSMEFFDCHPDGSCSLERAGYVKHEMDFAPTCAGGVPCSRERNRRVSTESTVYVTDGNRAAYTDYSSFDGLGHHRQVNTGLMVNGSRQDEREVFTGYNLNIRGFDGTTWSGSSVGTYSVTGTGFSGFTMLAPSDPWLLETYTSAYSREAGLTAEIRTCFDPRTGFLHRKRLRGGTAANDLLSVFTPDPVTGYVKREEHYGGDDPSQALGDILQNVCTMSLPASSRYRIDHAYQAGSLMKWNYADPSTGLPVGFLSVDFTIEPRTGLPSKSRDAAGLVTNYTYDGEGRLTSSVPEASPNSAVTEAATTYRYFPATGPAAPARVEMKKQDVETIWYFDALGRIRREKRRMPDGSWSVRDTDRNTLGQVTSVSELVQLPAGVAEFDFVPAHRTRYSNFDAFGRARAVTAPDGSISNVAYSGVRQVVRTTHGVATNTGAGTPVSTTEEFDRYGRLARIRENSGAADWAETAYGYDASDRLRTVSMTSPAGVTQSRSFVYDGRGFLVSETHPESGTTSYKYDARGHVTERRSPEATLTFQYDAAERLTKMWDDGVLLKELVYDRAAALGKLDYAIRHNHHSDLGDVQVKETYSYQGPGGRLSSKKTEITGGPTFQDKYEYDPLGAMKTLEYPSCTGCPLALPPRAISMEYSAGSLKKVGGYATLDYWPNGMLKSVHHESLPNTARPVDEQSIDAATGLPRPTMITFSNFCADFRIQTHPVARTVRQNQQAGLTVLAPGAQTYQWYAGQGESGLIAGATGPTLTIPATVTGWYWVRASNGACTVDSQPALLTVEGTCGDPPTASVFGTTTVNSGATVELTVTLTGAGPWTLTWSDGVIESNVQSSPHRRPVTPPATTTYLIAELKDANGCPGTSSGSAVVTVNDSSSCTPPTATIAAFANVAAYSEQNTASVPETAGASYVWSISGGNAVITSGQGTRSIFYSAPMCSGTFGLTVTVTTNCGTATKTKLVSVRVAQANIHTGDISVDAYGKARITTDLTGVPPWEVTWFDGLQELKKTYSASPASLIVQPEVTTEYRITSVTSSPQACPGTSSGLVARVIVPCTEPDAALNVPSTSIGASAMGSASVTSTTAGVTYQWSITNGTIYTGANSSAVTYRAGCAGPAVLTVAVRASCGATVSRSASIAVTPLSTNVSGSSRIVQGSSATISAAIDGVGPWKVTWSDGVVQNNVTTSPATRAVSPDVTTTYGVTSVSDPYGCSVAGSGQWVVTVAPPAPSLVTAVATANDRVLVQWAFGGSADEFRIERFDRVSGSPAVYRVVGTASGTARSYLNVSIPTGTSYLYRVVAVKGGEASVASPADLATTVVFADDPIISTRTTVTANQILQLRTAVDAVRALAQLGPGSYTSTVLPLETITRAAIDDLRTALDGARAALSLPPTGYTDRPLPVQAVIRGIYWSELRGGVK